ncbi:MAG: SDR family NAD(P)-dependent oxidoreductase [Methylothermaceae bacterium]|nr:SDR family NAD(P)-dependent oxidoreductase [Methylothermaceae bacterium]
MLKKRLTLPEPTGNTLSGRAILITGAAGALGRAAARACVAAGARVVLLDKDVPGLEALRDEILTAFPHADLGLFPMDLAGATPSDHQQLARILSDYTPALHGMLHNAARLDCLEPLDCLSPERWFRSLQVNLNAPYLLTHSLLPLLKASGDASVVFTSDSGGRQANAYWGAYGVSKVGLEAFARILAEEWASAGVLRANILVPGPVRTPIRHRAFPGEAEKYLTPPDSLVKLYVYLLGPESRGQCGYTYIYQDEWHVLRSR